ncbi:phenylalanine--tRNA ligase subunit beta [Convivina praedatoris]|uniref:Phenylalanine--tRNA ligase beta subunit n=1 Tax=Convivina praedatoris TaxID=2880963 RepID=A0ABN8H8R6_9LACO|nr:phenylalanine--tRNA ligase subunit beta [Convivina sp. LMG 32447]CAH1852553.1 Phenylalanine--tRNA ligase beta subunit [Convivina sp. LMG 32447]CAH1852588.1 Phenylalanine--tRNA ligase beta subunit [Convivina sp. LMG 32447]CAH1854995.1 Phenylalanine--tRNA ligase beta subunit [Convivina sp. LMG 32447]
MKTNLRWLNEYLDQKIDLAAQPVQNLAETLERTSVEVDSVGTLAGKQDGLVVAKVLSVEPHPDSDHMVITQVSIGQAEPIQIVTGAPNVAVNQLVILAQVGAHIIDRQSGELVEIKTVKLRGEESFGMLAALQEIGFDSKIAPNSLEEGIYVFDEQSGVKPGDNALEVLGMLDPVIDTDLTPNRSDMLSMIGAAYEFGAILKQKVTLPTFELKEESQSAANQLTVNVDEQLAPKYGLRIINNVQVQESPLWLQRRLWNAGIRPINNIVDITNYMMILYGQPLHAYDLDKLPAKQLDVRLAQNDEKLTLLDGQECQLRPQADIVIASAGQPLVLAGVMGGQLAEIDQNTHNLVLEGAIFDASHIRAAARRHTIHSEASGRFERGVDADNTFTVLDHAASMVADLAAAQVAQGRLIGSQVLQANPVVTITVARINQILGTDLSSAMVADIFDRLGLLYQLDGEEFTVNVPGRRPDLSIPADLIEEVARLYGYDNLPTATIEGPTTPGKLTIRQRGIRASRRLMESMGLNQAISYALTTPEKARLFANESEESLVALDYPMSSDRRVARQNLLAGLLDDISYNSARSVENVALYEQGRIFINHQVNQQPTEKEHLAGVLTGNLQHSSWQAAKNVKPVDFYDIKGIVTKYCQEIGLTDVTFQATDRHVAMHPGQTADIYVKDVYLGFVGQIHPQITQAKKLNPVFGFELDLEAVLTQREQEISYIPVSRYPQISRDLAILVDENISNQQIEHAIKVTAGPHLVHLNIFDLYQGDSLPTHKKSMAYQLTYQDRDATLVEEDINQDVERIIEQLKDQFQAEIR